MKSYLFTLSYLTSILIGTMSAYAATPIQTKTIPLDNPPLDLVITPDGSEVYVATYISEFSPGVVALIDTSSNEITSNITTDHAISGEDQGRVIAITPDGSEVYVAQDTPAVVVINTNTKDVSSITLPYAADSITMNPNGSELYLTTIRPDVIDVMALNTDTKAVKNINATNNFIAYTLFSPDGTKAYALSVPDGEKGVVCVIDTALSSLVTTIEVGINDLDNIWYTPMAISSDGSRLYVLNSPGDDNTIKGSVSIIDTGSNDVIDTVEVGIEPSAIGVVSDDTKVYALNFPNPGTCSISVIDTSSRKVIDTVEVGEGSDFMAISPDGSFAYVTNSYSNTVSIVDTSSNKLAHTVKVGENPIILAITPDSASVYVLNQDPDSANQDSNSVTQFNAPARPHTTTSDTFFTRQSVKGVTAEEFFATLEWEKTPETTRYNVFRDGVLIATLPSNITTYVDNNLRSNRTYTWTLDAITENGTVHYHFREKP